MGNTCAIKTDTVEGSVVVDTAFALHHDFEGLPVGQRHGITITEHRQVEQVVVLSGIGIEAHHVEGEPRRHCSRIVIARQAVGHVGVVIIDNTMDAQRAQVGPSYPMIEAWREERGFIRHVVITLFKEQVEALAERLLTATCLDESRHVVGNAQRIFLRGGLVEKR